MKKAILFFAIFFTICTKAQIPPAVPPPLIVCDNDSDGIAVFDLTAIIPMITGGMNPQTTAVTFYETFENEQSGTNPIPNPTVYMNSNPDQFIYIRIVDNANSHVYHSVISLVANPAPIANPGSLSFCDPVELAVYELSFADNEITGGAPDTFVSYYHTIPDAQSGSNPIDSSSGAGYFPTVYPIETLFARVTNAATGCFSVTSLSLNTNTCINECTPPTVHYSSVTETSFSLILTSSGANAQTYSVSIVPYGMPPGQIYTLPITAGGSAVLTYPGLPNTCYTVYTRSNCNPNWDSYWSDPFNICMTDCANTGQCSQALALTAFIDTNNNGIKDNGEQNFDSGNFVYQANDSGTDQYGSSNGGSYYIFDTNPANSYDIHFAVNSNFVSYYSCSTAYSNITLPTGNNITELYFPVIPLQPYVDSSVSLYPQSSPRPGFSFGMDIYYNNLGLSPIANGTITFTKDPHVTINSVSEAGATITPTGFTYNFTNLLPNVYHYVHVNLQVPTMPTVNIGDFLTNSITIDTENTEAVTSNNTSSYTQIVVGSYDPNEKSESHGGKIGLDAFTNSDYLYYTIQFENTGTAATEFIRIEDLLDAGLDESTFEMISASHTVNTKREGNHLTWHFYNLHLPTTATNPNDSHGYVYFRIKPKTGYAVGDIIPNTASIYFDYNPPIVTNTFNTEFFETLGTPSFNFGNIDLFPNPASNLVTISNHNPLESIRTIAIYDILGKKVFSKNSTMPNEAVIDVSHFAKGLYLVELVSDKNSKITKKLIIK